MSLAGIIHTTERDDIRVDSEAALEKEELLVRRNRAFLVDACGRRCHDVPREQTGTGTDAACRLCFRNNIQPQDKLKLSDTTVRLG